MNARPAIQTSALSAMVDRLFNALGYERKKPPQLTRIIILKPELREFIPELAPARQPARQPALKPALAPVRNQQQQLLPMRPQRY